MQGLSARRRGVDTEEPSSADAFMSPKNLSSTCAPAHALLAELSYQMRRGSSIAVGIARAAVRAAGALSDSFGVLFVSRREQCFLCDSGRSSTLSCANDSSL